MSTDGLTASARPDVDDIPALIKVKVNRSLQDHIFRFIARVAGSVTLALMAAIALFLVVRSSRAIRVVGLKNFLTIQKWLPANGKFGIGAVLFDTCVIAVVAIVLAVPVSIGAALFVTEYAPKKLRRALTSLIDLLAAVPSIIYGLWGLFFLEPRARHVSIWLTTHLGFVPFFKTPRDGRYTGSAFIVGIVVALMVTPICTSVMREVFSQAPPGEREGALALGATRWGMVRTVVIPFGRGGIVGGTMLGLGRALGETIAVTLIVLPIFTRSTQILHQGAISIAALIALRVGEANPLALSALMAAGLALFALTLAVNTAAAVIVSRSRSGSATEI
jgi:phosphate transport system permease protein